MLPNVQVCVCTLHGSRLGALISGVYLIGFLAWLAVEIELPGSMLPPFAASIFPAIKYELWTLGWDFRIDVTFCGKSEIKSPSNERLPRIISNEQKKLPFRKISHDPLLMFLDIPDGEPTLCVI